jgi:hypothetical protein
MSWLRVDDDMLDHEKWRRALREGGDAALTVWWRLSSWCSRRLTDGRIPADMVAEIACLERSKSRTRALQALVDAHLCERHIDGAIVIVNYLERNPSRADVLAERERRAQAQKNYADRKKLTGQQPITLPAPDPVEHPPSNDHPSQSHPVPSQISLSKVPGLTLVVSPEQTDPATHIRIPEGWTPSEGLYAEAFAAGVTRTGLEEAVKYWRGRKLGGEWFSPEDFFRGKFAAIKLREEKTRFAAHEDRKSGPRAAPGSDLETTSAATAFTATGDHKTFAARHGLDLAHAVSLYRKGTKPAELGTVHAWDDFMNRLKCWAATGTFHADGPLPRPGPRKTSGKEATA